MDMSNETKRLEEAFENIAWAQAQSALGSLRHAWGSQKTANAFGIILERGFHRIFDHETEDQFTDEQVESIMSRRLNYQSGQARHLAHMALGLSDHAPELLEEIKLCCARMASHLSGAASHWDWQQEHDLMGNPPEYPPFYYGSDLQKNFLAALTLSIELDRRNVALGPAYDDVFHQGISEFFNFKSKKLTAFGEASLMGHAYLFRECYMTASHSPDIRIDYYDKMASLAEAREISHATKPSLSKRKPAPTL